jgi:NAD(P)-dependent dehydrogenase (short-subunit alcohol dehydrogenase family)
VQYAPPVPTGERIAVITGGSSGIGEALARRLRGRGWSCVLIARGQERLERVAAELGAEAEVCDVADEARLRAVAARVLERHPAIGLLVNNAGVPGRTGFLAPAPERIEPILRVNYLGTVWPTLAFLPGLERSRPSHVVNVVSVAGTVAVPASGPYSAAKHAQLAFSRALTVELAPRGISVHTINPGLVETPGFPQRRDRGGRRRPRHPRGDRPRSQGGLRAALVPGRRARAGVAAGHPPACRRAGARARRGRAAGELSIADGPRSAPLPSDRADRPPAGLSPPRTIGACSGRPP